MTVIDTESRRRRSRVGAVLRVAGGLALLVYILSRLSIGAVIDELLDVIWIWAVANLAVEIVTRVVVSWKWFLLLRERDPSARFLDAIAAQFIGVSVGSVVPLAGMDLTIGYAYYRQSGRAPTAVSTVFVDRLITIYAAVFFTAAVLVSHRLHFSSRPEVIHLMGWVGFGAVLSLIGVVAIGLMAGERLLQILPAKIAETISSASDELVTSLAEGSRALIANVCLSLLLQPLRIAAVVTLALAVGLKPELTDYALMGPLVFLFLFAWIGWEQGVFVVLLGTIGVPAETAFAMSIINRLVFSVSMLPGVVCVLTGWGLKPSRAGIKPAPMNR